MDDFKWTHAIAAFIVAFGAALLTNLTIFQKCLGKDVPDVPFDVLFDMQKKKALSNDDRICEEVAASKEFKMWVSSYCLANVKKAEESWGDVVTLLKKKGCVRDGHMVRLAIERTSLMDKNDNGPPLLQHLLTATERKLGPDDRYVAVACSYLAAQFEGSRDFTNAATYRRRELLILQKNHVPKCFELHDAAYGLEFDLEHQRPVRMPLKRPD